MVRETIDAAKIGKHGSCHSLRYTMATLMLENGADIRFIQAMRGHAELSTTQIYTQVSVHQLKAIHTATHPGKPIGKWGTHSGETADETLTAKTVLAALDAETQDEASRYPHARQMAEKYQSRAATPPERADSIPSNPQSTAAQMILGIIEQRAVMHPCVGVYLHTRLDAQHRGSLAPQRARNGLMKARPAKSRSLSVTTVQPLPWATAAMIMSSPLRGRPCAVPSAINRAQINPA